EERPTGTAGSLVSVPGLHGTFLVMNGDILTNLDYRSLVTHHKESGALLTIAAHRKLVKIDLGILQLDNKNELVGYIEKPTMTYPVSMGIYVYEAEVLEYIEPGEYLDFPNLVLRLLARAQKVGVFANDAYWHDLGRYEDFQEANRLFSDSAATFLPR